MHDPAEDLFDGAVRTVAAGPGWRAWRPSDPAHPAAHPVPGERCAFANLSLHHQNVPQGARHAVVEPMCLAREDVVSERVRTKGRWYDCHNHALLWKAIVGWEGGEEADVAPSSRQPRPADGVLIEVGANVGVCTLELLHRTNARIIAFEPSPVNLYHLTRTLRLAAERHPAIARRVVVMPLGAGRSQRKRPLFAQRGNLGNTVIGASAKQLGAGSSNRWAGLLAQGSSSLQVAAETLVVPLDEIFPTGLGLTRVVTMDARAAC